MNIRFQNKTNGIKEREFVNMENKLALPILHNIGNNKVLLENPQEVKVYRRCQDDSKDKLSIERN